MNPAAPVAISSKARAFVRATTAEQTVRFVHRALHPLAIDMVPLKGVILQRTVYEDVADRDLTDVDILVPHRRFPSARNALLRAGARSVQRRSLAEILQIPGGLTLDLHHDFFRHFEYRFHQGEVLERATANTSVFGFVVRILEPHDHYAYLLGKFVSDHGDVTMAHRWRDLTRLQRHHQLCPVRVAQVLHDHRMRRAARYATQLAAHHFSDPFAARIHDHLHTRPLDAPLFTATRALRNTQALPRPLSALATYALQNNLARTAALAAESLIRQLRAHHPSG